MDLYLLRFFGVEQVISQVLIELSCDQNAKERDHEI